MSAKKPYAISVTVTSRFLEEESVPSDDRYVFAYTIKIANEGSIPQALLPQLFNPFRERSHKAGRNQGLGLGLYIVQQIVLAHGGSIEVDSSDGRTNFRVQLPRTPLASSSVGRF